MAVQALFHKLIRPEQLVRLPVLVMLSGNDLQTDMGPMELGGLITAMGPTRLDVERLDGYPFMLDGISYWEAYWPDPAEGRANRDDFDGRYVY